MIPPQARVSQTESFGRTSVKENEIINRMKSHRKITDTFCLLLFIVYLGYLSLLSMSIFFQSSPSRLTHSSNFHGKICGKDSGVSDKPYLYYPLNPDLEHTLDLETPLCVATCFSKKEGDATTYIPYPIRRTVDNKENNITTTVSMLINSPIYDSESVLDAYCLPTDPSLRSQLSKKFQENMNVDSKFFYSITKGILLLIPSFIIAAALSYAVAWLLSLKLTFVIALLPPVLIILMVCFGLHLMLSSIKGAVTTELSPRTYDANLIKFIFACVLFFMSFVVLITSYLKRKAIKFSITAFDVAAEVIHDVKDAMHPWLYSCATILLLFTIWILGIGHIVSVGKTIDRELFFSDDPNGDVRVIGMNKNFQFNSDNNTNLVIWTASILFLTMVIERLVSFAVSYMCTVWYFTAPNRDSNVRDLTPHSRSISVRAMLIAIQHHLGSCILGAFTSAILFPFRIILSLLNPRKYGRFTATQNDKQYLHESPTIGEHLNAWVNALYQKLNVRNNSESYIAIAIDGDSYCLAANTAHRTIYASCDEVKLLSGILNLVSTISSLCVATVVSWLVYYIAADMKPFNDDTSIFFIQAPILLAITVFVFSFIVSHNLNKIYTQNFDAQVFAYIVESNKYSSTSEPDYTVDRKVFCPSKLKEIVSSVKAWANELANVDLGAPLQGNGKKVMVAIPEEQLQSNMAEYNQKFSSDKFNVQHQMLATAKEITSPLLK